MKIDTEKLSVAIKKYMAEHELKDKEFYNFAKIHEHTFYKIMAKKKIRFLTAVKIAKAMGIDNFEDVTEV